MQNNLSKYRDELKGFAILWIVLFHAKLNGAGFLYELTKIGYGGVDIFMLFTGFGLYRSLEKSAEGYLRRRALRVLPSYLPFCALWLCCTLPGAGLTRVQALRTAVANLTMTGMLAGVPRQISWYMTLLLMAILLAPLVHATISKAKNAKLCAALWAGAALVASVGFWGSEDTAAYSRLPIFVIGMLLAASVKPEISAKTRAWLGLAAFTLGLAALYLSFAKFPVYLNDCGLYWYPFILITPPLCGGLAWLFAKAQGASKLFAPLRALGKASFEIFLFNCWAEQLVKQWGFEASVPTKLLFALASVLLGLLYRCGVSAVVQRVRGGQKTAA